MASPTTCRARQFGLCVAIVMLASTPALAESGFRELTVRLEHAVDAAPVSIRLSGGAGLIAVGQREEDWRFSVISLADGSIVAAGVIPEGAFFYDTGDPQGRGTDQLCFFSERGVSILDPAGGEPADLIEVGSLYHGLSAQGPAYSDFVRDFDGDAADDVLVPLFDGWLLARQRETGFDRFVLQIPPRVRVFDTGISYQPRQPRIGDVDGDGLNDLMFLRDTEFVSFVQRPAGQFSAPGRHDHIDAPLASEEQRARWERDDGQVDQSDLQIEEIELVRDFDDDGIPDLLTEKSISEGVFDRRSEYHLYLGRREAQSLKYAGAPDGSIASDGVQFDPLVVDVDGDGRLDLVTPSTRLGLTRIVTALFSGRISVDLDVYRMQADGGYPAKSDYRTRFKVEFDLETGLTRYPAVRIADFDGDGHAELLVQEQPDELTLYPGVTGAALFGKNERTLRVPLPINGQMVEARDLDDDGRADLIIRYGPADGAEFFGELRVLLSVPEG